MTNSETFVVREEERAVAPQRASLAPAKLVLAERRNRAAGIVKEVLGIERAVAQELISGAGKPVCAGARGDIDLGARRDALLRRVRILEHLEFADGVDRRVHRQAVRERLHQRDPVEREIVALRALSINREPQAEGRRVELLSGAVRIGRHGAGGEQRQLGELAAVQRKLGHAPVVNFVGDRR